ncbi:hypothetical protein HPC62_16165 [Thermoleptolyngbya sichuanensis A183]|uniref:Uncharacterized protein n=1 Tax=Thermoleptolyngbya sichuanensis A183 TaxID=2737172 RepID=A0A6M8BAD7_9CYAN|nr:hypothetical protein [Thermoleptolyngbya sichuanensis]QKD83528.1 hypothetical protein HPC62_16165 [Thermoleptolyngbya sichuanensis A183]
MSLEVTAEKAQQIVTIILNLLGNPANDIQLRALEAFRAGDSERIKFLSTTHPEDHFCRALNYLISVPKLTPNTFTIAAEALRAAGDHVRSEALREGGKALELIFSDESL